MLLMLQIWPRSLQGGPTLPSATPTAGEDLRTGLVSGCKVTGSL